MRASFPRRAVAKPRRMIGVMNKTEQAYAVELERRKLRGEIIDWLVTKSIAARPLSTAARAATNSQSLRVQRVPTPLSSVKSKYIVSKTKN